MKEHLLPTKIVAGDKIEHPETLFRPKGLYAIINLNI